MLKSTPFWHRMFVTLSPTWKPPMSGEPSPIVQVRLTGPVPTVIDPFPIALIGTAPSVIVQRSRW